MKSFFTLLIPVFLCSLVANAQMPKSEELGKHDGIPAINITEVYLKPIVGLTRFPEGKTPWSNLQEANYVWEYAQLADPKKVEFTEAYGLDVARIEVFCNTSYQYKETDAGEEEIEGMGIYAMAVYLKLPETNAELTKFYSDFKRAYAPALYATGYRNTPEGEVEEFMWHSTNKCGAMMSIPKLYTLEEFKGYGMEYIEIQYTPSCGG